MADDVYKLVQQALAQSQGGSRNQFYNPTSDLLLQIPQMMRNEKDKLLIKDSNTMSSLVGALSSANSDLHFDNLGSLMDNTDVQSENQIAFDNLKNLYTDKREAYNQGKKVYNDVAPTIGMPIADDKYYLSEEKLMNFDFGYDENGNSIKPKVGENQIDLLKRELENVSGNIMKLENSQNFKFGKVENKQLLNKLNKYKGTLTKVMKARFGGLSPEEVDVILWQDDYTSVQNNQLKNINSALNTSSKNVVKWQSQYSNLIKKTQSGSDAEIEAFFAMMNQAPELEGKVPAKISRDPDKGNIIIDEGILGLKNHLSALITQEQRNQIELTKQQKAWQKFDTQDNRDSDEFFGGADIGAAPDNWTPFQQEILEAGGGTDASTGQTYDPRFEVDNKANIGQGATPGGRGEEIKQRLIEIESTIGANTDQSVIEPLMKEGMLLREELENINANKTYVTNDNNNGEQFVVAESNDPEEEMSSGMNPYVDMATDIVKNTAPWVALAKADKIAIHSYNLTKNLTKSAQHIYDASKMSNSDINKFLKSDNVQAVIKRIDKLKKQKDNFQPGQLASKAKIQKDIDNLINDSSKRFSQTYNTPQTTMKRLLQNPAKWNWLGYKQGLVSKTGAGVKGIGSSIIMGEVIAAAIESKTDYEVGQTASKILPEGLDKTSEVLETAGLGYISKKLLDRTWIPKVFKMLTDDKAQKYLKEKLIKKYGKRYGTRYMKRLVASAAAGKKYGGYATVAAAAYTLGDIGMELYDEVMAYNTEDPVITRGSEMKGRKEYLKNLPEVFNANRLIDKYSEEYKTPYKIEKTGLGKSFEGTGLPVTEPTKTVDRDEEFKLLNEFKNKYNLNDIIINLLSKLNRPSTTKRQKEYYKRQINKELKKLGLLN